MLCPFEARICGGIVARMEILLSSFCANNYCNYNNISISLLSDFCSLFSSYSLDSFLPYYQFKTSQYTYTHTVLIYVYIHTIFFNIKLQKDLEIVMC